MPFALITGASKGIGKAIAELLAARGYDLLLVARSAEQLEKAATEIQTVSKRNCKWLSLDLSVSQSAEAVAEWCTNNNFDVAVLVNNAGYGLSGPFEKYSPQEHADMLQLNIITLTKLTRLMLPMLKRQESG
ncbi:MAG TPA: SDR family NAD(P)-dependent oxidoreductase, partial [Chitinophagaceae bacterium]